MLKRFHSLLYYQFRLLTGLFCSILLFPGCLTPFYLRLRSDDLFNACKLVICVNCNFLAFFRTVLVDNFCLFSKFKALFCVLKL